MFPMRGRRDMMMGIASEAAPWSGTIKSDQIVTRVINRVLLDCPHASASSHVKEFPCRASR
jgi:hypothetical protein